MGIWIAIGAVVIGILLLANKLLGKNNQPFDLKDIEIKEWKDDDDDTEPPTPSSNS